MFGNLRTVHEEKNTVIVYLVPSFLNVRQKREGLVDFGDM